jgi:hypothetical protein
MTGLGFILMILAPPLVGLVFGLLQLIIYLLLVKIQWIKNERVPFFPILWLRGMMVVIALGVMMAIFQHLE